MAKHARRLAPKRWLARLVRAIATARANASAEVVHAMRVALGRLRTWLRLGGRARTLDHELRWLRRACGRVRDLDVLLALHPPASVARDMRASRARAAEVLRATLDDERVARAIASLEKLPAVRRKRAKRSARKLARRAIARGESAAVDRGEPAALHELRRAVRSLRYALEWLGRGDGHDVSDLTDAQDALGEACDRTAALRAIESRETREARAFRERLSRERRAAAREAAQRWTAITASVDAIA
jgi:CHAD domain-containing protein